jgi:hypothetical protein
MMDGIVLDTPEQIATYKVLAIKQFAKLRASKNPFVQKRPPLRELNRQLGTEASTWADLAALIEADPQPLIERVTEGIKRARGESGGTETAGTPAPSGD